MAARHRKPFIPQESDRAHSNPPQTCPTSGKRMYATDAEAQATAAHQMSEPGTPRLRTYRCLYCDAWHLTSKST